MVEFSPGKVGRTIGASNILHSVRMKNSLKDHHITPNDISGMGSYYTDMIKKYLEDERLTKFLTCYGRNYKDDILSIIGSD